MPIFEYSCDDCGSKFEKLIRRPADVETVDCPACRQNHLTTEYSTFSARAASAKTAAPAANCGAGACGSGFCGSGMCGVN